MVCVCVCRRSVRLFFSRPSVPWASPLTLSDRAPQTSFLPAQQPSLSLSCFASFVPFFATMQAKLELMHVIANLKVCLPLLFRL